MTSSKTRQSNTPRDFLSHKEQRKLLALVMGVGLVVLLISEARKPDKWRWLWEDQAEQAERAAEVDLANFDTRFQPQPGSEEDDDTIRILPFDPTMVDSDRYYPGVEAQLLRDVEDYAPFRSADGKAWFHLLGILQEADSASLRRHSGGTVSFLQLYEQPQSYRGELVTLNGTIKRATRESAARNSEGIEGYYQLVLQPLDGPLRPVALKVLKLPEGFPVEDGIREEIEVTGFFFKNLVYLAEDGNDYIMPVVLAKDVTWKQAPTDSRWVPSSLVIWGTIGGTAVVAALLSVLVYYVSQSIKLPGGAAAHEPLPGNFEALQTAPIQTVEEQLGGLADKE